MLHCIGSLGGGGAERQLSYLLCGLVERGVVVDLAYIHAGPNLSRLERAGVRMHQLRGASNYDPRLVWSIRKIIRSVLPQLVQTWLPQMDTLAGAAALLTRTPYFITERSIADAYDEKPWRSLRRCIGRGALRVIANSEGGRQYWASLQDSAQLIRNGIPADEIQTAQPAHLQNLGLSENGELILFAGRYSAEKNVVRLLEAVCDALNARPSAVAVFFGEGPDRDRLLQILELRQLQNRIRILGYTDGLWSYMKRAAVFASVSRFEGCPNTIIEAAIQECPLLLSNIPQHRELFEDAMARFVDPNATAAITNALVEMLRDPDCCKRKAAVAKQSAARFTIDAMVDSYLEQYYAALDGKHSVHS